MIANFELLPSTFGKNDICQCVMSWLPFDIQSMLIDRLAVVFNVQTYVLGLKPVGVPEFPYSTSRHDLSATDGSSFWVIFAILS